MDIFISWSGNRSQKVAELLNNWLKYVIQAVNPWISTHDIDRGAVWFTTISENLSNTKFGIICLTQENKNQPWILFEAGAIARGVSVNRVCTLLIDLRPTDVENPLAQFNHTIAEQKESVWELIKTINKELKDKSLPEPILINAFNTYWPQFKKAFEKIISENAIEPTKRNNDDILADILSTIRAVDKQLRQVEVDNRFIREGFRREKLQEYMQQIEMIRREEEANLKFQKEIEEEMREEQRIWEIEHPYDEPDCVVY